MIESTLMEKYADRGLDREYLEYIINEFLEQMPYVRNSYYVFNEGGIDEDNARQLGLPIGVAIKSKNFIINYLSGEIEEHLDNIEKQQVPSRYSFS